MKIGFIEPHLKLFGGIRHVLEIGNELVRLGHDVRLYIPRGQENRCHWMECLPEVRYLGAPEADALDAIVFNNEPDFAWLDRFASARLKVYWLLHFAWLYDKAFSWLSYRCPVDVHLAESRWIAQCLQREIGVRAVVINSGVNPRHFRPLAMAKTYEVLCYGDRERDWKGTGDIEAACRLLDLPLEKYDGKGIPQERMAEEYGRAKVFVHGSWYEGFGLPGLEALACGVPLVTTDSGGPRDYAFHEQTALIVPPRDPRAMADAIRRLRGDPDLAARLVHQGLDLVARQFQGPATARERERCWRTRSSSAMRPRQSRRAGPAAAVAAPTHIAAACRTAQPGCRTGAERALRAATSELVVVGDDDPPAVLLRTRRSGAHGDRAAPACVATGALGELLLFSHGAGVPRLRGAPHAGVALGRFRRGACRVTMALRTSCSGTCGGTASPCWARWRERSASHLAISISCARSRRWARRTPGFSTASRGPRRRRCDRMAWRRAGRVARARCPS
ncbi:MAG: glycosyltransferase family 4 protein [Planctomycetota bacterium]